MTDQTVEDLRLQIARLLPDAMERAVASYSAFISTGIDFDPKAFANHHTAARTALNHLGALLKLAEWALAGSEGDGDGLEAILADARRAAAELREGAEEA